MIIRWFDSVLLLCLYGCMPFVNGNTGNNGIKGNNNCNHCTCACCEGCSTHTQHHQTTFPTQNPSTSVCNCPTTDATVSDYSQRPITSTRANKTATTTTTASTTESTTTASTKTASTTTSAITTITVSSANLISQEEQQEEQKSCSASENHGAVIGAAIGGTIFGSIMTAIVFVFFRRRLKNPNSSKKDQTPRIVRNAAYGYNSDRDQVNSLPVPVYSAYTEILNDGMRKSAVISPILRQEDSSKIDEVYNHLGESEKEDRSDYYDHAGPAPSLSVVEDGYGVLSVESGGNDNYNTVDGNYSTDHVESMTAENKQSDDYFILESQNK